MNQQTNHTHLGQIQQIHDNSCNPELHDGSQSAGKFPRSAAKINWQLAGNWNTMATNLNFPKATLDHERLPSGNFNLFQSLNIAIDSC